MEGGSRVKTKDIRIAIDWEKPYEMRSKCLAKA